MNLKQVLVTSCMISIGLATSATIGANERLDIDHSEELLSNKKNEKKHSKEENEILKKEKENLERKNRNWKKIVELEKDSLKKEKK